MHRWCSKLRSLAALSKPQPHPTISSPNRLLHTCPNLLQKTFCIHPISSNNALLNARSLPPAGAVPPHFSLYNHSSLMQVRYITAKQRKKKLKSRRPATPVVSKVKKIKMKGYSSFKGRFRLMHDGQIRRWKEGKRHNAHLKSKKAKRRLRRPGTVPVAYAKVMKKLNFCA